MSFKFNPITATFDKVEKPTINPGVELAAPQAIFNLLKPVKVDRLLIFEQQALSVRPFTKTGDKQITFNPAAPAGTTLNIIQL